MATLTTDRSISIRRAISRRETPAVLLIAASLVVGLAIVTHGEVSKTINGIGGMLWILAAAMLFARLKSMPRSMQHFALAFGLTLTLVLLVKPSDLLWAAIGFTIAGAVISVATTTRRLEWAALLSAIWLPTHLLVAIVRVAERSVRGLPAHVRTDPPPTAALVPFAMVLFALLGSWLVVTVDKRRRPAV